MNKAELIAAVAEKTGMSKKDTEAVIVAALNTITEALADEEKVQLVGFGSFEVKKRAERTGLNPKTMETIAIPAGPAARELSGLLALNGSGQFLFDLLQTEQTEDSLVQAMLDAYDIDDTTARTDVAEFVEILRSSGVLLE